VFECGLGRDENTAHIEVDEVVQLFECGVLKFFAMAVPALFTSKVATVFATGAWTASALLASA